MHWFSDDVSRVAIHWLMQIRIGQSCFYNMVSCLCTWTKESSLSVGRQSVKRTCTLVTYSLQHSFLRSSTHSDRYDFLFGRKTDWIPTRAQSSAVPPPSDPPVLKGRPEASSCHHHDALLAVRARKAKATDYGATYTENKLITAVRAMHEFLLKPS